MENMETEEITERLAATEAIRWLASMSPDPAATEAKIRAILVNEFRRAGDWLPHWLHGPAVNDEVDA